MKSSVLIVEDDIIVGSDISECLEEAGYEVLGIAESSDECFQIMVDRKPDAILMDIRLKGDLDGVEIAKLINEKTPCPIIYITANNDPKTLERVIATKPAAFISKPFNPRDLEAAIEIGIQKFKEINRNFDSEEGAIYIKKNGHHVRLECSDIRYLEADGSYCNVHTTFGEVHTVSSNLQQTCAQIRDQNFMRVHRSYVINKKFVDRFDLLAVEIRGIRIPVSKKYRKETQSAFNVI